MRLSTRILALALAVACLLLPQVVLGYLANWSGAVGRGFFVLSDLAVLIALPLVDRRARWAVLLRVSLARLLLTAPMVIYLRNTSGVGLDNQYLAGYFVAAVLLCPLAIVFAAIFTVGEDAKIRKAAIVGPVDSAAN